MDFPMVTAINSHCQASLSGIKPVLTDTVLPSYEPYSEFIACGESNSFEFL